MRILDIDLDFFLSGVVNFQHGDERPSGDTYKPWTVTEVREYLHDNLGLAANARIPGSVEVEHDAVFWRWQELIDAGKLRTPFEVVHVDAHADLGLGGTGFSYIHGDLLHQTPAERYRSILQTRSRVDAGNFLLYALALRWIDSLVYVPHKDYGPQHTDVPTLLFPDRDPHSGEIRLPRFEPDVINGILFCGDEEPSGREPKISFRLADSSDFEDVGGFDFMFLAQSPFFTPQSADALIEPIAEYIAPLDGPGATP